MTHAPTLQEAQLLDNEELGSDYGRLQYEVCDNSILLWTLGPYPKTDEEADSAYEEAKTQVTENLQRACKHLGIDFSTIGEFEGDPSAGDVGWRIPLPEDTDLDQTVLDFITSKYDFIAAEIMGWEDENSVF